MPASVEFDTTVTAPGNDTGTVDRDYDALPAGVKTGRITTETGI